MKEYYYKTKLGTFHIKQKKNEPKKFELWIGDELLGTYFSEMQAADAVYTQTTDHFEWDSLTDLLDMPSDLFEWEVTYH